MTEEYDGHTGAMLLDEITARASGRRHFTFNVFDLLLDFDAQAATITDVLEADSSEVIPLQELRARLIEYASKETS
jgi:hypothetical protein